MKLEEVVDYQNALLRIADYHDYPNALNGLQIENSGTVTKVAAAVDACEAVLQMAVSQGADLLIVHHGLFWAGLRTVTGAHYRKLKMALENNLAIYSAHLPLDAHPEIGNNALLCNALGLPQPRRPFLEIGWQVEAQRDRQDLHRQIQEAVGGKVHFCFGGPATTRRIGVVTGGAGGEVFKAAAEGVDTFITGEGPHWSFTEAEELGLNVFYAGHYATEVFGVRGNGQISPREPSASRGRSWIIPLASRRLLKTPACHAPSGLRQFSALAASPSSSVGPRLRPALGSLRSSEN